MLLVSFILALFIEIGFPILLAFWFGRKHKTSWLFIGIGVSTFIISQIIHIPLLTGISALLKAGAIALPNDRSGYLINALILGFLAGICEEPMRWIGFRLLKKKNPLYKDAVALGIGHGGVESVFFIGFSVLINLVIMTLIQWFGISVPGITKTMAAEFWAIPWYMPFAGALERLMTILFHIFLSVVVWLSIKKENLLWLLVAVAWHALVDSAVVYLASVGWSTWSIEGIIAFSSLISIFILWLIWRVENSAPENNPS